LIVDIARLDPEGEWFRGELSSEILDLQDSEILTPVGGLRYDLFIQLLGTELLIRGTLKQRLACVCVRCAETFETEATDPAFTISIEISEGNDFPDLTAEIREAIILVLPGYPVCHETCKGLCMACGVNLNHAKCSCKKTGRDGRWAALDALK